MHSANKGSVIIMDIIISNSCGKPIYEQITVQIKNMIMTGKLASGDLLPSIRLLAKELRISVITSKRAYEDLERDGFITTVAGKGCYVSPGNKELLREQQLRQIEGYFQEAIELANIAGITCEELGEILDMLYKETY